MLALGLARKGLPANMERACIVVLRVRLGVHELDRERSGVAPVRGGVRLHGCLLALTTDRTISVVRRHVLGMREDASVWARLGQHLGRAALWAARLLERVLWIVGRDLVARSGSTPGRRCPGR